MWDIFHCVTLRAWHSIYNPDPSQGQLQKVLQCEATLINF